MKKKLFSLLLIGITFLGVRHVNADSVSFPNFYANFDTNATYLTTYSSEISTMVNYWNNNLRSQSGYYIIFPYETVADNYIALIPLTSNHITLYGSQIGFALDHINRSITYNIRTGTYNYSDTWNNIIAIPPLSSSDDLVYISDDDILLPSYSSNNYTIPDYRIQQNDIFPTVSTLANSSYNPDLMSNYTTLDFSNYEYVILSLKNYNQDPFDTTFYVQGQLCLTPVYDYGMKEKFNYYSPGYKVQSCTTTYYNLSSVPVYIIESDLVNHSVYYINKPDNSMENIIKVDTNVFNISYITQANLNNPTVTINGRQYPTIPYNDLTDTAIISSNEGYISGQSCALGDVNCYSAETGINIDDLFTDPLKLLKSVWGSILAIFTIITTFIAFLPPTLQGFLFTAFMLAIILGIIKIIL